MATPAVKITPASNPPVLAPSTTSVLRTSPLLVTGAPGWLADAVLAKLATSSSPRPLIRCLVHAGFPESRLNAWRSGFSQVKETVLADLADAASLTRVCEGLSGGTVLHSAGIIHPRKTRDWYTINRDGALALARAAKSAGARRFVFISSNAAQGRSDSRDHILTEDMPDRPLSHYGRSKLEAEQGLLELHDKGRFDVVILRPCMFYGPPVPERHIDIFKRVIKGKLPMVGDGNYARSLSYIDDLANGILLAMEHPSAPGEIFNICDRQVYTTREICEAMAKALGVAPRFWWLPSLSSSTARVIDNTLAAIGVYSMNFHLLGEANWNVGCSSEKAQRVLGFNPQGDVREGYRQAVAWAREKGLL
ncbi:MAG TPA: NAD(P)-dependent oxidoreductase [Planctomycetota bacterium]|nr:NAD(P)-dependent oxidoreductase [Planctomycetota bacterium]